MYTMYGNVCTYIVYIHVHTKCVCVSSVYEYSERANVPKLCVCVHLCDVRALMESKSRLPGDSESRTPSNPSRCQNRVIGLVV